ncbi:hypothetical protein MLC59_14655 [Marinobacter bryozoorum]|uniref:ankyrin repeat domain-containing protein n=1 Tax=Marinobacter bryozoorum TaxID=256324 RepID=UPI002006D20F|nr:ankyrin repeat domain-containing protein [Marinobacter bryozoorum]MCK7545406.1 hypothetical protein [Marinobacter bryozoorum]
MFVSPRTMVSLVFRQCSKDSSTPANESKTGTENRDRSIVQEDFLEKGVDVNAIDTATGSGVSALHSAVLERNPFAVELLLEHGASVSIEGEQGRTPLDFARLLQEKESGPEIADIIATLENT